MEMQLEHYFRTIVVVIVLAPTTLVNIVRKSLPVHLICKDWNASTQESQQDLKLMAIVPVFAMILYGKASHVITK